METMTAKLPRPMGVHDVTDAGLVERLSHRDSAALEALYDRYGSLVYSTARAILRDAHLAEDVSQEVFLRLWRQPEKYAAEKGAFVTWLLSVTRNRAVDCLRTRGRRSRLEATLPEQQERELRGDNADDPALSTELADQRRTVLAAMTALPRHQRQVIALAYFGGLTQREMAQRLGHPLGTVKTRVRDAMQRLRQALQVTDEAPGWSPRGIRVTVRATGSRQRSQVQGHATARDDSSPALPSPSAHPLP